MNRIESQMDLSLRRISRLLTRSPQSWNAIHVAGTNGKGSICAYLSAMIHATGRSCGRFTSPHLVDRWDCISINEQPVSESAFHEAEALVRRRNQQEGVAATSFELLTATAFEIFQRQDVRYGIVEVGMGGTLDATNALKEKAVTVISKISLDHQAYLGSSIEEIALHKAGIMHKRVACVVDGSNKASVLQAIEAHAAQVGAPVVYPKLSAETLSELEHAGFEPHQVQNFACAQTAFQLACPNEDASVTRLLPVAQSIAWPGRLQRLDGALSFAAPATRVLLDGAHNRDSAEVLGAYVDKHFRQDGKPVAWVIAMSDGKDVKSILRPLLRAEDVVYAVTFGSVDGMPWVKPTQPSALLKAAVECGAAPERAFEPGNDLQGTIQRAAEDAKAKDASLVIAGSLYLVSDVLRLIRGFN
jgi:folylpolyglutamate synthase/dihydrofolate synthase